MHRLILSILTLIFLSLSCQKSANNGLIPVDDMPDILTDVHLVDGYLNTLPIDSARKVVANYYEEIYKKYHTDSTSFKKSLLAYSKDTKVYQKMYLQVEKKLFDLNKDITVSDSLRLDSIRLVQQVQLDSTRHVERRSMMSEKMKHLLMTAAKDSSAYKFDVAYRDYLYAVGFSEATIGVFTQRPSLNPAVVTPQGTPGNPKKMLQQDAQRAPQEEAVN